MFDLTTEAAFARYEAVRRRLPTATFPATSLHADYTGIRPKLYQEGEPVPDFRFDGPAQHGLAGLIMLFGIESPGLTSSMAIGDHVADLLGRGSP